MSAIAITPPPQLPASTKVEPYIVGIGASAGGLEALQHLFASIDGETTMSFVVVQHLSPDFKSLMDELLGRHTRMPIHLAEHGMQVEPGHVYLIPPKKELTISSGKLLLGDRDRQQELNLPIDVFFRSLAEDCGRHAIAIVLSGTGSDGSRGILDVHDAGGLVLAQDIDSAQFDGMPRTAQDTGVVDWILRPQEMPRVLEDHVKRGGKSLRGHGPGRGASGQVFTDVYRMLEQEYGLDFTHYKPTTVTRRIERRLQLARVENVADYVERLRSGRGELDVLYRDLLIGVTRFFRNEDAFEILERAVLPELLANGPRETPLRVWVAGCATGEEAYSLAILLHELTQEPGSRSFKIFATDVHRGSLEVAGRAFYGEESLARVSQARRDRYFVRVGRGYQLVPELRQSIVFAPHNVIRDAPFTRVDLVSCRNMLIYLQPAVQQKVLNQFHFSLNRGGAMILGPSESPGPLLKDFDTIDRHWRIYRKHSDNRVVADPRLKSRSAEPRFVSTQPQSAGSRASLSHLLGTYDVLLDEYMPSSLLVSDRGELLHSFGGASKFLKPRDGRQAVEIAEQVDESLKLLVTGGMRRALVASVPVVFKNIQIATEGQERRYHVTMRRVASRASDIPNVLISFAPVMDDARQSAPETEIDLSQISNDQMMALRSELEYTKANLQAAIEQLETGNEELQASNEELMSSNEELQSTNEELQSVNEELYTVNAEYQSKISELTDLTNDMDNLLASTEIGTVFLDGQLKIRKFTPQVAETFNLLPHDVGRSIETFTSTMDHPELAADVRRVLASGERVEREISDRSGYSYFLRILPYKAKGGTAGVVITFVDVSGLKEAEDALFHERYLLNSLLSSVPDAIYFRDQRGKFIRANPAAAARLGLEDPAQAVGKMPHDVPAHDAAVALHRLDDEVVTSGKPQYYKLEKRSLRDGGTTWDLVTRLPLTNAAREVVGVIGIVRDVTTEKIAEAKIQEGVKRRDEFLAMLSHELRNPLAAVVTATEVLKHKLPEGETDTVDILDRQSQQMARLLDDLLDASRVTQNKIELRKEVIDLRTIVEVAAAAARPVMEARDITFTVVITGLPLPVAGDASRLQQVCMNMLTNASKYTPSGGHVMFEASDDGPCAVIRVRDDGVGIAPDMTESIFEMFVQSSRTLERAQGGIGVGLTLARSLIQMHGGTITVHSDGVGRGSTFEARLPLSTQRVAERIIPSVPAPIGEGSRIVVVEDNVDARDMLCHLLTRAGYDCKAVGDGAEAIQLIESFRPQAAIIDVGLPGIDGFEVARRLRANPRTAQLRLIALTGYGQKSDREIALGAGFDEHLVKPVKFEHLAQVLAQLKADAETNQQPVAAQAD